MTKIHSLALHMVVISLAMLGLFAVSLAQPGLSLAQTQEPFPTTLPTAVISPTLTLPSPSPTIHPSSSPSPTIAATPTTHPSLHHTPTPTPRPSLIPTATPRPKPTTAIAGRSTSSPTPPPPTPTPAQVLGLSAVNWQSLVSPLFHSLDPQDQAWLLSGVKPSPQTTQAYVIAGLFCLGMAVFFFCWSSIWTKCKHAFSLSTPQTSS